MLSTSRFIPTVRLIAGLTFCSRVLGLVRECLFSHYFGTSEILSAFRVAFMVPNLARRLFGEGALSSAMIPVLTETIETRGEEPSRRFVGSLLVVLVTFLVLLVIVAELVLFVWRGFQDDLALELAAILMPYMALICTVAVASGVLNVRRHFAAPAAAPMILNLAIILTACVGAIGADLRGRSLIILICGGVLLGGVVQLLMTGFALRAVSFFPIFSKSWRDPQLRRLFALMGPMVLGMSAVQINSLMDYLIAYLFVSSDGQQVGPAVLGYAQYLYQLPLGVFGIAVATAVFPMLSQQGAKGDRVALAEVFGRGLRLSLFIALPASVGLLFVATPLVATLYEHGASDASDTERIAGTLFFYSLGMVAYFTQHILVRTFYALKDSRTPARTTLCMVGINLVMNLLLVQVMEERGLALATAICATIQVVWLLSRLKGRLPEIAWRPIGAAGLKMLIATGMMALVLAVVTYVAAMWVTPEIGSTRWSNGIQLALMVTLGVAGYAIGARLLRIEELATVLPERWARGE